MRTIVEGYDGDTLVYRATLRTEERAHDVAAGMSRDGTRYVVHGRERAEYVGGERVR